jgi:tRNA-splicing endonuclease subunit Sen54
MFDIANQILAMDVENWESSSDSEVNNVDEANDEEHWYASGDLPKLQFRKDMSKAIWNNEMKMAEIVEKKGSMWTTTGIARNGKIYCSIEETLFLTEVGALNVFDDDNNIIPLEDMYKKISKGEGGCCWESFEVYRHLKSLGYIVARHNVPWSVKNTKNKPALSTEDESIIVKECEDESQITELFSDMKINEARAVFDVYPPNSKFKKSSPGDPLFVLCITTGGPPKKLEILELERECNGHPMKFCHLEQGRVSFFSFNKVDLPVLP